MSDDVQHEDDDTPNAADDTKRLDQDNALQGDARPGDSEDEGPGASPVDSNPETTDDPKGSQRPV